MLTVKDNPLYIIYILDGQYRLGRVATKNNIRALTIRGDQVPFDAIISSNLAEWPRYRGETPPDHIAA